MRQDFITLKNANVKTSRTPSLIVAALAGTLWLTNAHAADDDWKFYVTPYLWLPTFNATFKYSLPPSTGSPEVEVGPIDYLNNLDFLLMLAGEARKGDWSIFTDYINLDVSGGASHVKSVDFGGTLVGSSIDVGTQTSIKGYVWTLGGGYTVVRSADASINVIGGVRYLGRLSPNNCIVILDTTNHFKNIVPSSQRLAGMVDIPSISTAYQTFNISLQQIR